MEKRYVPIKQMVFPGKNPDMKKVEDYLNAYLQKEYMVEETKDIIRIGSKFASEFCGSEYTKRLKGAILKTKANCATIIPELIRTAHHRRWDENKAEKHRNDACKGWYRYDVGFSLPVYDNLENQVGENLYEATLLARINDYGIYLYDVINIKKEASKPFES